MEYYLFIGLGGTGDSLLRVLRKRVIESFGTDHSGPGVQLGYIYMDADEQEWKYESYWNELFSRINQMIQVAGGQEHMTVHICAGLAEKTASGMLIDLITHLQKWWWLKKEVYLYLYVPDYVISHECNHPKRCQGSAHAVLQELNALAVGKYKPVDTCSQQGSAVAFKQAFLFSDSNEAKQPLSKDDLFASVAEFIFQQFFPDGILNLPVWQEMIPDSPERDAAGCAVHARSFATFAVKRVAYPEREVQLHVCHQCARSVILSLLYNVWVPGRGYVDLSDEPVGCRMTEEVRFLTRHANASWLDMPHITLQSPVSLPHFPIEAGTWESHGAYWHEIGGFFRDDVFFEEKDKAKWLSNFRTLMEDYYEHNFRSLGVEAFFQSMKESGRVRSYAWHIANQIEEKLFADWCVGMHEGHPMSLQRVRLYLQEWVKHSEFLLQQAREQVGNLKEELRLCEAEADRLADDYAQIGFLRLRLFPHSVENKFREYAAVLSNVYEMRTMIEALGYAQLLLDQIKAYLTDMHYGVSCLEDTFLRGKDSDDCLLDTSRWMRGDYAFDPREATDKRGQLEQVPAYVNHLLSDECFLQLIRSKVVEKLKEQVHPTKESSRFAMLDSQLRGVVYDSGSASETGGLIPWMADQILEDVTNNMKVVTILERLQKEFPTQQQLDAYLEELVRSCSILMKFNPDEIKKVGEDGRTTYMGLDVLILVPAYDDSSHFRDRFIQCLLSKLETALPVARSRVSSLVLPNEIVMQVVYHSFPLRFVGIRVQ